MVYFIRTSTALVSYFISRLFRMNEMKSFSFFGGKLVLIVLLFTVFTIRPMVHNTNGLITLIKEVLVCIPINGNVNEFCPWSYLLVPGIPIAGTYENTAHNSCNYFNFFHNQSITWQKIPYEYHRVSLRSSASLQPYSSRYLFTCSE